MNKHTGGGQIAGTGQRPGGRIILGKCWAAWCGVEQGKRIGRGLGHRGRLRRLRKRAHGAGYKNIHGV